MKNRGADASAMMIPQAIFSIKPSVYRYQIVVVEKRRKVPTKKEQTVKNDLFEATTFFLKKIRQNGRSRRYSRYLFFPLNI